MNEVELIGETLGPTSHSLFCFLGDVLTQPESETILPRIWLYDLNPT
jgi:hypothetical protein